MSSLVLNFGHKLFAGGLMALTAGGFSALVYGLYRIKYVKPRELAAATAVTLTESGSSSPHLQNLCNAAGLQQLLPYVNNLENLAARYALPVSIAILAIVWSLLFGRGGGRRTKSNPNTGTSSTDFILTAPPRPTGDDDGDDNDMVLVCRVCGNGAAIDPAHLNTHVQGKKHMKFAKSNNNNISQSTSLFEWVSAAEATHLADAAAASKPPSSATTNTNNNHTSKAYDGGNNSDSDDDNNWTKKSITAKSATGSSSSGAAVARRNVAATGKPGESLRLQGKGVAVVFGSNDDKGSSSGGGGWTKVAGDSSSNSNGGGGSNTNNNLNTKHLITNLMYSEGSRNILQGFTSQEYFINPAAETLLVDWIDLTIREGQSGRLRGNTLTPPRGPASPLSLNFGCYYDWIAGSSSPANSVDVSKSVKPIPTQLRDFCRKIQAKSTLFGGLGNTTSPPDSVSIYDVQPGIFLPPHIVSSHWFKRPVYMLCLGGHGSSSNDGSSSNRGSNSSNNNNYNSSSSSSGIDSGEDLLFGLSITSAANSPLGEFNAGFAHRLKRRSLVALTDVVSTMSQHCLGAVQQRTIIIVFRHMQHGLASEMQALGNSSSS